MHVLLYAAGSASDAGSDAEELDAETALDLLSLGIVNPVTKESAGAQYQQQLARQVEQQDRKGCGARGVGRGGSVSERRGGAGMRV